MWSLKKTIPVIALLALTIYLSLSASYSTAAAPEAIVLGPWSFEEVNFADEVVDVSNLNSYEPRGASTLEGALLGYSPESYLVNIGSGPGHLSNLFQLTFTDLLAENNFGADIVFFECRFDPEYDPYEIAIRPEGGAFTDFLSYFPEDFVDTGVSCDGENTNWGVVIDISQYGLAPGTVVDAIRFSALDGLKGFPDGDPTMAAVYVAPPLNIFLPIVGRQ